MPQICTALNLLFSTDMCYNHECGNIGICISFVTWGKLGVWRHVFWTIRNMSKKVNWPFSGPIHDRLVLSIHNSTQSSPHNRYSPSNFSAYLTQIGTFKPSDKGMAKCMFDRKYSTMWLRMQEKTEAERSSTCISLPLIRRNSGLERILQKFQA